MHWKGCCWNVSEWEFLERNLLVFWVVVLQWCLSLCCRCPVLQALSHRVCVLSCCKANRQLSWEPREAGLRQRALLQRAGSIPAAIWGAHETSEFASKLNTKLKITPRRQGRGKQTAALQAGVELGPFPPEKQKRRRNRSWLILFSLSVVSPGMLIEGGCYSGTQPSLSAQAVAQLPWQ